MFLLAALITPCRSPIFIPSNKLPPKFNTKRIGQVQQHTKNSAGYGTWKDPNSGWTWVGTMAGDTHTMVGVGLYTAANGMITHGARDANGSATGPCYVSNAPDGTTCTSNFVGGYPNGITTLTWPNGNSAQVLMVNGVIPTSSATFTFANGDKYTGPMQNGELNGGGGTPGLTERKQ